MRASPPSRRIPQPSLLPGSRVCLPPQVRAAPPHFPLFHVAISSNPSQDTRKAFLAPLFLSVSRPHNQLCRSPISSGWPQYSTDAPANWTIPSLSMHCPLRGNFCFSSWVWRRHHLGPSARCCRRPAASHFICRTGRILRPCTQDMFVPTIAGLPSWFTNTSHLTSCPVHSSFSHSPGPMVISTVGPPCGLAGLSVHSSSPPQANRPRRRSRRHLADSSRLPQRNTQTSRPSPHNRSHPGRLLQHVEHHLHSSEDLAL
mmetsp:Transcript_8615/g.23483  ORF Transcript_8615/g.23483 Transcript_8615/m.23483 type:complete len:258 (-) Transcript_8615:802-1575(-)